MIDLQKLMDLLAKTGRDGRESYHLTLGKLIKALREADPNTPVIHDSRTFGTDVSVSNPHSYRGYYEDLAFEPDHEVMTAKDLLNHLETWVLDRELEGYKGGMFKMTKNTPLWISPYGESRSIAVVDFEMSPDGSIMLLTKNTDDKD